MKTGSIFAIALGAIMVVLLVFSNDFGENAPQSLPVVTIESGNLTLAPQPTNN